MKILHFSDIQTSGKHLEEVQCCCTHILVTAAELKVDLIMFTGDMFDSADVRLDSAAAKYAISLFRDLAMIAPVSVIIGTPSHDGKCAEILRDINAKNQIHVTADQPEQLLFRGRYFYTILAEQPVISVQGAGERLSGQFSTPDAIITAFPQPTKQWFKSEDGIAATETQIADGMTAMFRGFGITAQEFDCPHILSGHWQVSGCFVSDTQILTGVDIEVSTDQMDEGRFDLGCLGHIHKAQQLRAPYYYAGSTQSNTWGELDEKGFWIHDIDLKLPLKDRWVTKSEFIKTPTRPMVDLKVDCTEEHFQKMISKFDRGGFDSNAFDIVYGLRQSYPYEMDDGSMVRLEKARVRLNIKVFVDDYPRLDVPAIKSYFDHLQSDLQLEVVRMPRVNVRSQEILDQEALFDKIKVNAKILEEEIPAGVKEKANLLDEMPHAKLVDIVKEEVKGLIDADN